MAQERATSLDRGVPGAARLGEHPQLWVSLLQSTQCCLSPPQPPGLGDATSFTPSAGACSAPGRLKVVSAALFWFFFW